jgi:DNA-binding NarL/FixJ family response regulator
MDDMHDAPTPTLAVAVPQALIADAFSRLFREAGFRVVGSYADVETLIDKVERGHPDLVLIDPVIEEHDGRSSTLARLCEAQPPTKVVVLATRADAALARALLRYGVRGLILESSPASDAVGVLRQVADGQVVFPSAVMTHLARPDELAELSERQRQILELLAAGDSNGEIAQRLYISANTVKFHLREIYSRLGVRNRVEAASMLQRRTHVNGPSPQPIASRRARQSTGLPTRPGGGTPPIPG